MLDPSHASCEALPVLLCQVGYCGSHVQWLFVWGFVSFEVLREVFQLWIWLQANLFCWRRVCAPARAAWSVWAAPTHALSDELPRSRFQSAERGDALATMSARYFAGTR